MISRMVDILTAMIKPAGPTQKTKLMIQGNAENWGYNTLTILMDHYKEGLDHTLEELDKILVPDWKPAFQVATRWARKSLQRVTPDALGHAEALIAARGVAREGQHEQPPPQETGRVTVAVQTEREDPRPMVSVQTMPLPPDPAGERSRGGPRVDGWSVTRPLLDSEGEEELPSFQVPLEQRPTKKLFLRKPRGEVLREEDLPQEKGKQVQQDLIDWTPVEDGPGQSSPLAFLRGCFTLEEEGEDSEDQYPLGLTAPDPAPSLSSPSQGSRNPFVHTVQVHRGPEEDEETRVPRIFTDCSGGRFRARRHPKTQRKLIDWEFVPEKKWILMGDSNLGELPGHSCDDLQIESFPGGHFRHAQALLEKARPPTNLVVEKIILSFGIDSRENKSKETTIKNLQGAIRSARNKFPYAEILVPLVNFSNNLPIEEQRNLQTLNDYIQKSTGFIRLLPQHLFRTEEDNVHWTKETGEAMLRHWWQELNWPAL